MAELRWGWHQRREGQETAGQAGAAVRCREWEEENSSMDLASERSGDLGRGGSCRVVGGEAKPQRAEESVALLDGCSSHPGNTTTHLLLAGLPSP